MAILPSGNTKLETFIDYILKCKLWKFVDLMDLMFFVYHIIGQCLLTFTHKKDQPNILSFSPKYLNISQNRKLSDNSYQFENKYCSRVRLNMISTEHKILLRKNSIISTM